MRRLRFDDWGARWHVIDGDPGSRSPLGKAGTRATSLSITAAGPLLQESSGLQKQVKNKTAKTLAVTVTVTSPIGMTTSIPLKLAAK
jgi:hypothetical protein